jgi:hypothetical protein
MDFIIILMFSLYQLKICETGQIRALILHVYRMGLFQTVISGLIYFYDVTERYALSYPAFILSIFMGEGPVV